MTMGNSTVSVETMKIVNALPPFNEMKKYSLGCALKQIKLIV